MRRRTFLQGVGVGAVVGGFAEACARESVPPRETGHRTGRSRVAVVVDHSVRQGEVVDPARLAALFDQGLKAAVGGANAAAAWRALLPQDVVVGVKLNCLAGRPLSPSPELVDALVGSLRRAGVSPGQVVVFERGERDLRRGGFEPGQRGGVRTLGNDSPGAGYEEEPEISGEVGSCLSRILTRRIGALINVGVLKDHSLSGIGVGMKNLFGLIHNPNKYHDQNCDPFLADVLAFPQIQQKLKLTVVDALTAQCHGGPGYVPEHAWSFDGLLLSTDVVALDRVAWELIEARRKARSLPTLKAEGREPTWLRTAAARGLGQDDLARIDQVQGG